MASVCLAVGSAVEPDQGWIATFPKLRGTPDSAPTIVATLALERAPCRQWSPVSCEPVILIGGTANKGVG